MTLNWHSAQVSVSNAKLRWRNSNPHPLSVLPPTTLSAHIQILGAGRPSGNRSYGRVESAGSSLIHLVLSQRGHLRWLSGTGGSWKKSPDTLRETRFVSGHHTKCERKLSVHQLQPA